jgi:tRNA wybutosine-synthesizing protein 2
MRFKTALTTKLLESSLSGEEINLVPSSYQALDSICLIKLPKELQRCRTLIARTILQLYPQFRSVCAIEKISGEFRQPHITLLAGQLPKEVTIRENNCIFKLNPDTIMYSQGNHYEKKRVAKTIKENEIVVDMFAGIGYFSIPIAKSNPAAKVFAVEKNLEAFRYLQENARANYIPNVFPILGDSSAVKIPTADRILMGLIPSCKRFIPAAMRAAKKGTIIHYHGLAREGKEYALLNDFKEYKVRLTRTNIVKSYKPYINHVVLDLEVI